MPANTELLIISSSHTLIWHL